MAPLQWVERGPAGGADKTEIIFASDEFVVRWEPAGALDVCVVTFDSYNDVQTLSRDGFAERYLKSKGVSAIHVISRGNDWYQYPDIPLAMAKARKIAARYARVVTYGTSMGGYAAIRFADMVGAHAVIALSPQYSIDPAKFPFEKRWLADGRRIEFLPALDGSVRTKADVVVAFDPTSPDAKHVELIAQDIKIRPIRVSYAGHSVPAMLSEAKLLDELVHRVLIDKLDAVLIEREIRHRRRDLAIYFAELASRQPPHRPKLAVLLARRAADLNPTHDIALRSLADRLSENGEFDEAIAIYQGLVDRGSRQMHYLLPFSKVLAASGQYALASEIAAEIITRGGATAGSYYWLSHLLEQQGELEPALTNILLAIEAEPNVKLYKKTAALLKARLRSARRKSKVSKLIRWLSIDKSVSS